MSYLIAVFVLLCVLQQGLLFPKISNNSNRSLLNSRNPTVGDSLSSNTPAVQPASRPGVFHDTTDIRTKLRSRAKDSNGRSSGARLGITKKRLHDSPHKSVTTHTVKPHNKITPIVKKVDKKKRLNKVKRNQNKVLSSRSGLVDDSADVKPQPSTYNSGTDNKSEQQFDSPKKGPGIVVQPKNLY